jgi:class 3 adenylate cyclase
MCETEVMQDLRGCVADDGAEIAYAVSGEGGPPLVLPAWWVSDLEKDWQDPSWRQLLDQLGANHTVIRYDRPGMGQSAGRRTSFTQEDEVRYLTTLVDEIDLGPVAMLAMSCGGPPAISYAARYPDRVSKLVLFGSYADGGDIAPADSRAAIVALVRSTWGSVGSRTLADIFMPAADRSEVAEYARYQRAVSTPDLAADLLQMTFDMDARAEAPLVRCPVLVLHRRGDRAVHPRCGRTLAALIPAAEIVELDGSGHSMNEGDSTALVREVEQFLLGYSSVEYVSRRLATILFTDIVGSTTMATELGDGAWRMRLEEHDRTTRSAVEHHAGRVVKTTGDGVLAVFDLPTQALGCAKTLHRSLRPQGIEITAGIHVGEIEARGDDIAGIAVNVAARVQSTAVAGTTRTTAMVRDLSAGSGHSFAEVTTTELKGVGGTWTLYEAT